MFANKGEAFTTDVVHLNQEAQTKLGRAIQACLFSN
jgi:hypothetical protein